MKTFFALHALKFLGIGLGVALIFSTVMYIGKLRAERSLEKAKAQITEMTGEIERQNEAIEAMHQEGQKRQRAFAEANRRGRDAIRQAQRDAVRLRSTPANGCPTPPEIFEAPL